MQTKQRFMNTIYFLQNNATKEIIYVGATTMSLKRRLQAHYSQMYDAKRGGRKMTKRYAYLIELLPIKVSIHLIEEVSEKETSDKEIHYISLFRSLGHPLLNMTKGGKGGFTSEFYSDEEKEKYGNKISVALKGRKKPIGFAENLSNARKGLGNTRVGTGTIGKFECLLKGEIVKEFTYPFEADIFVGVKGGWRNIKKVIDENIEHRTA